MTREEELVQNYKKITEKVNQECQKVGRSARSVSIMCVSKTYPLSDIQSLHTHGIRCFGENRAQETIEKFPERPDDLELHFIGHIQRNKVKKILPRCSWLDSIDSQRLLNEVLKQQANTDSVQPVNLLFEVNTSGETQKSGIESIEGLYDILDLIDRTPDYQRLVNPRGLMTIGPLTDDESRIRRCFRHLRTIFEEIKGQNRYPHFDTLSMGMSSDFPIAIQEGSTMIRIGTHIFGKRNYA